MIAGPILHYQIPLNSGRWRHFSILDFTSELFKSISRNDENTFNYEDESHYCFLFTKLGKLGCDFSNFIV